MLLVLACEPGEIVEVDTGGTSETSEGDGDGDASGDGDGDASGDGDGDASGDGDGDASGDGDGDASGDGDGEGSGDGDGEASGDGDGEASGDGDGEPPEPLPPPPPPLGDCEPLEGWSSVVVSARASTPVWTDGAAFVAYERYAVTVYDGESDAQIPISSVVNQVWARALDDIWIAADRLYHFDGECLQAVLEPSSGYAFSGVTGSPDGEQLWAVEQTDELWCDIDLCGGESPSWHRVGEGEWQLDDFLVPDYQAKLRYHSNNGDQDLGTAWSYGLKISTWSVQGWSDTNTYAEQLWNAGTEAWAHLESTGVLRYFDGVEWSGNVLPYPGLFAGWEDEAPHYLSEWGPNNLPVLHRLDGPDWEVLAEFDEPVDVDGLLALSAEELLLSSTLGLSGESYQLQTRFGRLTHTPELGLETIFDRDHRSCNSSLFAFGNELGGLHRGGQRWRDDQGEWHQGVFDDVGTRRNAWLDSPTTGWTYRNHNFVKIEGQGQITQWSEDETPGFGYRGMWGVSADEIYAVFQRSSLDHGWIYEWDGETWSNATPELLPQMMGIHATEDRVVGVGDGIVITREGEGEWTRIEPGPGIFVRVWISESERLWVLEGLDSGYALWTWDGADWSEVALDWAGLEGPLTGFPKFAGEGDQTYMLADGVLGHFDGVQWSVIDTPQLVGDPLDIQSSMTWTGSQLVIDDCSRIWSYTP